MWPVVVARHPNPRPGYVALVRARSTPDAFIVGASLGFKLYNPIAAGKVAELRLRCGKDRWQGDPSLPSRLRTRCGICGQTYGHTRIIPRAPILSFDGASEPARSAIRVPA